MVSPLLDRFKGTPHVLPDTPQACAGSAALVAAAELGPGRGWVASVAAALEVLPWLSLACDLGTAATALSWEALRAPRNALSHAHVAQRLSGQPGPVQEASWLRGMLSGSRGRHREPKGQLRAWPSAAQPRGPDDAAGGALGPGTGPGAGWGASGSGVPRHGRSCFGS